MDEANIANVFIVIIPLTARVATNRLSEVLNQAIGLVIRFVSTSGSSDSETLGLIISRLR